MKIFNLFLNYSCNAKCGFCFNPHSPSAAEWKGMSTEKALALLMDARKDGFESASFIGGEATVRKDLVTLVAGARKLGYKDLRLVTNGVLLAAEGAAERLAAAGLTACDVSIHSHRPEVNDVLLGLPGATAKQEAALKALLATKVRVGINCVIAPLNAPHLAAFTDHFADLGARHFSFFNLRHVGHMELEANFAALRLPMADAARALVPALARLEARGLLAGANIGDFTPCALPGYEDLMTDWAAGCNPDRLAHPDGRVEDSDPVCSEGRAPIKACETCVHKGTCLGVDERYLARFGDAGLSPVKAKAAPRRTGRLVS